MVGSSILLDHGLWSGVAPKFKPLGGRIMCEDVPPFIRLEVTLRQLRSVALRLSSSAALGRCSSEFSISRLLLVALGLLLLLLLWLLREAIGEAPEPPPFSSDEVEVSSSDWAAFNWSDRLLTLDAVSEHSDEMAVVMVGMVTAELLDAICE